MRKIAVVACLSIPLFLASCKPADVLDPKTLDAVQKQAAKLCGFVPSIGMIGSIIATYFGGPAGVAGAQAATAAAQKACDLANTKTQGLVGGIEVEGWKVH